MSETHGTVSALTRRRFRSMASTARRRIVSFVALLSATLAGSAVAVEPITARLEWDAGDGARTCIDGPALAAAVETRWGRSMFVADAHADVVASGRMQRRARGFRVTIELRRKGGENLGSRTLETTEPSCHALDDSVALALGLMLDVSRQRIAEERLTAPGSATSTAESVPGAASTGGRTPLFAGPTIAVFEPRERRVRFSPWLGAEASAGLLPSTSLAARAGLSMTPPTSLRVELGASVFAPTSASASPGRGVTASALTFDAGLCLREWEAPALSLYGCAFERVGRIRGEGFGFSRNAVENALLLDAGLREVGELRLSPGVALRIGLELEVPLVRYRFVFEDAAERRRVVDAMSQFAGGAELGIAATW